MRRPRLTRKVVFGAALPAALLVAVPLIAQESDEAQKSGLLRFVEDRLSTPERQISLNGLDGVLSSDVSIDNITISDEEGVWLRIDNAQLNWDQGALLTGRLQINSLTADSIDYIRPSIPPEGLQAPAPEAGTLEIPELPVAVFLEELSVPSVTFGEEVFGLGSEISLEGSLILEGGSLDTSLDIERLDGPGGTLSADIAYARATNELDLDLTLREPSDGVVANLLNIEGRPELALTVQGSGPVDGLDAQLALDADGARALSGTARLTRIAEGLEVAADLNGPIARLMPAAYGDFFGDTTHVATNALVRDSGGFELREIAVSGGELRLTGSADTAADGFLNRLSLEALVSSAEGSPVTLPVPGQSTRVDQARFVLDYGDGDSWSGTLDVAGFTNGALSAETVTLDLGGAAVNLEQPEARRITLNADGAMRGIATNDPRVAEALGDAVGIGLAGLWNAGEPIHLAQARIAGKALEVSATGEIADFTFDGAVSLDTPSLAPFSGLAGRQLSGGISVNANGTVMPLTGGFDLTLNGEANNLGVGIDAANRILAGQTRLSGRLARTEAGFEAEQFRIGNPQSEITADGTFSSSAADFDFRIALADLGLLSENASGALTMTGRAGGRDGPIALRFNAEVPSGRLLDKNLTRAALGFDGTLNEGAIDGKIDGNAFLDGYRVDLTSDVAITDGANALRNFRFETVGTRLTGTVEQNASGLLRGDLSLDATDISTAAALFLVDAEGAAEADISLAPDGETQSADITARLRGLSANDIEVESVDLDAAISDLFGVPQVDGSLTASTINAGVDIASLSASASYTGDSTAFTGNARLANGTRLSADGSLAPVGDEGYSVGLNSLDLTQGNLSARLVEPAAITIANDQVQLDAIRLQVGSGQLTATGSAGEQLSIDARLTDIPLSIANAVVPDLGLSGTLNGTARVRGTADNPDIGFDMAGRGIGAAMLSGYGVTPLAVDASGSFKNDSLSLAAARVSGPQGLSANISGTMPLVGSSGRLTITGSAPLSLANASLGNRGTQVSGSASINASVTGSLANLSFGGSVSTGNGEIVDPQSNLRLQQINTVLSLNGDRAVIERFSGNLATGGSISGQGSISLNAAAGLPGNITLNLNSARYADGNLFVATASGQLQIEGALLRSPLLSGRLAMERAEISVPDLPADSGTLVDVDHVATPADVAQTLRRARVDEAQNGGGSQSDIRLDVTINAPNQVFVRGRGIDAELGGSVVLKGSLGNIQPVGGFELIRGRLNILTQRITFDSGRVTLVGDLDPYIDLSASSPADGTTVYVRVTGPVSDLNVSFSSTPALPEDEVLSLLIFKRALGDLSPLQLAKLAAAAAELAGGSNQSLVDGLREATGLADLDVVTDEQGNAAVRAGSYIQDNVYVSVQAGAQGKSKVSIDLDLTDTLKARGSTSNDGETSLGIFYEQDF